MRNFMDTSRTVCEHKKVLNKVRAKISRPQALEMQHGKQLMSFFHIIQKKKKKKKEKKCANMERLIEREVKKN